MKLNHPLMDNNITSQDTDKVIKFLKTKPILTQNVQVKKFENQWSKWLGVKYSTFVNSGSSANFISIALLKFINKNDNRNEIIVPPLTWVSDINSVILNGFKPIFADINLSTLSLNTDEIISKINSRTLAVFITHAQGFISLDARSSKSIMLFLVTGLFIINLINYYKKDRSLFIVVSILLYLSSLLYFNYGLNRSDSGHIRGASSFIFIPFISILLFFLFEKFNSISQKKIKYFNNLNFLLILIILVNTLFFEKKYEQKKITNIFTSKESALRLINYTDDSFISLKHRKFINYYKELTITDKCVFIFTNEVGLSYFLKKQSCSKHYFMFTSAPKKIQDELIGDIKNKKPKFIIYNSKKDNFYNSDIMLKTVNKFILNNYIFFKKFDDWDIYKIQ